MTDPRATADQLQLLWSTIGAIGMLSTWIIVQSRAGGARVTSSSPGRYALTICTLACTVVALSSLELVL